MICVFVVLMLLFGMIDWLGGFCYKVLYLCVVLLLVKLLNDFD